MFRHIQRLQLSTAVHGKPKVVVFGGNGFVGQAVISKLLKLGTHKVVSINRSGKPSTGSLSGSHESVEWKSVDIFQPEDWRHELQNCDSVISCIGAFGSNEFMEKINGDANILAVDEARSAEVRRFIYLSTVENTLPEVFLRGYFNGKKRAEDAIKSAYPDGGFILKPGFMYGDRAVPSPTGKGFVNIPLWALGRPLETILTTPGFNKLQCLPGMKAVLSRPIDVTTVGAIAAAAASGILDGGETGAGKKILSSDDMVATFSHIKSLFH